MRDLSPIETYFGSTTLLEMELNRDHLLIKLPKIYALIILSLLNQKTIFFAICRRNHSCTFIAKRRGRRGHTNCLRIWPRNKFLIGFHAIHFQPKRRKNWDQRLTFQRNCFRGVLDNHNTQRKFEQLWFTFRSYFTL